MIISVKKKKYIKTTNNENWTFSVVKNRFVFFIYLFFLAKFILDIFVHETMFRESDYIWFSKI